VVSRKLHGSTGSFDINLPVTGPQGIECRSGGANGDYTMIFTFADTLSGVGSARVSSGTAQVHDAAIGTDTHQYVVNLTGVANAQHLFVTLRGVGDSAGHYSDSISAPMSLLVGDVNGDGQVDSADLLKVKQQTLQPVNDNPGTSNFREDVNTDGNIDSSDLIIVKRQTLTGLP
jgi:hypothetical protein